MNNRFKLIIFASIILFSNCNIFSKNKTLTVDVLNDNGKKCKIYFKTNFDESVVAISDNCWTFNMIENNNHNMRFFDCGAIFYKIKNDTLEIIYPEGTKDLKCKFYKKSIKEVEVCNADFMNLWLNYSKLGYSKFPR